MRMIRYGRVDAFYLLLLFLFLSSHAEAAAPIPYFGREQGDLLTNRAEREGIENPLIGQLGGELIDTRDGKNDQRLLLLSWEKDFILERPSLSFLNVLLESDESRFVLEFPRAINPYLVLIAEYPFFFRFDPSGLLKTDRFLGLGAGAGVMKRTGAINYRIGAEWVSGALKAEGRRDAGQKLTAYLQLERDRVQRAKYDQPIGGSRLFFSLAQQQFEGFSSESEGGGVFIEGAQEWYHSLWKETTFGLIAREGRDSRPAKFWRTTLGSFQGDNFNVPLPGYLYQQFPAEKYLSGAADLQSWVLPSLLLHVGYHAAGGWDSHIYTSTSLGATVLLLGKLPLVMEGALGHAPSGALELLIGTAIQW
ncbi:MAG: hypothetical protein HY282_03215 [Nitrospirae bacterium]|nr:hypothetical protein [Candidatus Manganitrophaceae bacterium]